MERATSWGGLLLIGDPHLASRVPGFRKDDYPRVALEKLRWCLDYAQEHDLKPVLLGDLFHWPRENANWLMAELLQVLPPEVLCVPGNHDCHENQLGPHDSLTLLVRAGRVRLVGPAPLWSAQVNGQPLQIGGTSWSEPIPTQVQGADPEALLFWLTHHDVAFSGPVLPGRVEPFPIEGVDLVINGHIHNEEPDRVCAGTTWMNPGNISRLSRDALIRVHRPAAVRVTLHPGRRWSCQRVPLPAAPFSEVFHPMEQEATHRAPWLDSSVFIKGLGELAARRTQSGAGLTDFLEKNLPRLDDPVAAAITDLAQEVLPDDHPWRRRTAGHGHPQEEVRGAQQEEDPG
jgi:predicted phosphodiesterase